MGSVLKDCDLVIFDMDGTLIDTSPGIIRAIQYTFMKHNKKILEKEILKSFIGPPLQESFAHHPEVMQEEIESMVNTFRREYSEKEILNACLYDGVMQLCQRIHSVGIKMAVATNKPEHFAKRLISHFQLDQYMAVVLGADMKGTKHKKDLILNAMEQLEICNPRRVVMIGDTIGDAMAANQCDVNFIGVSYGFGLGKNENDLGRTKAICIVDNLEKIVQI